MTDTDYNRTELPADEQERSAHFTELAAKLLDEKRKRLGRDITACVVTFGCQMNARDSEKLRGILRAIGFRDSDSEDADLVIYNTCTVRENANTRVFGRLGQLCGMKRRNPEKMIGLCGCMMQEKDAAANILERFPFVDLLFGTHNIHRLAELVCGALAGDGCAVDIWEERHGIVEDVPTVRKYPFKSGVNIMYGCNNFCSYCIVPYVRGRETSREADDILREVRKLRDEGVQEVMLLGQNVNSYGRTLDAPTDFATLLAAVSDTGIPRVRFMTSHPKDLSDELIRVIASRENICRHLHLPLQSGSNRILKAMNRVYTRERYLDIVDRMREAVPDISLTTDLIVGFPGETEEDHEETMDMVRRVGYDTAFTFQYSRRTGTPAAEMPDRIAPDVVARRFDRLLSLVQEIGRERTSRFTGQTKEVLAESVNSRDASLITGRTDNNIVVHFPGDESLIGRMVPVRLRSCKGFYYLGEKQ